MEEATYRVIQIIIVAGTAYVGLWAFIKAMVWTYRIARRIDRVMCAVEDELLPNNGKSMKDVVTKTAERVTRLENNNTG